MSDVCVRFRDTIWDRFVHMRIDMGPFCAHEVVMPPGGGILQRTDMN